MNKEEHKLVKIVDEGTIVEEKTVILYENDAVIVCVSSEYLRDFFNGEFFEAVSYEKAQVEIHEVNRTVVVQEIEYIVTADQLKKIQAILNVDDSV